MPSGISTTPEKKGPLQLLSTAHTEQYISPHVWFGPIRLHYLPGPLHMAVFSCIDTGLSDTRSLILVVPKSIKICALEQFPLIAFIF